MWLHFSYLFVSLPRGKGIKMSFLKKFFASILCFFVAMPIFSACGSDKDSGKLTVFYSDLASLNDAINKQTDIYKQYMKDCGIEFKAITTGGGDSDAQLQKMFNVGELPDIFIHRTAELPKFYAKMIKDRAVLPISDYVSETKYPNIYKQLKKHDYLKSNIDFANGKHYAIPTEFSQEHTIFVRLDWIENLNRPEKLKKILVDEGYAASEAAVTPDLLEQHKFAPPEDLIEFYRLSRAFTLYDPDNNGKKDTYGYTSTKDMYSDNWLYVAGGGYRVMQDGDGDGTYTFSGTSDGNKYIVGYINRLLGEGYMDPSWISDTSNEKVAKFGQGKVGIIECQSMFNTFVAYFRNLLDCTSDEAAEKIAMIAPPKGRDGQFGIQGHPNFWTSVSLSANMSEAKREQALQFMDYLLTDSAKDLFTLGVEGVHYERDADGKLHSLLGKDEQGMNKDVTSVDNFVNMRVFTSITRFYYNPFQANADKITASMKCAASYNRYPDYYMLTTPTLTEYWDGLCDKMISEFAAMERNDANFNEAEYMEQKMKDISWDNLVIYNDNFNRAWKSYVELINKNYKGSDIEKEYNQYAADHGVKTIAPDITIPEYEVV